MIESSDCQNIMVCKELKNNYDLKSDGLYDKLSPLQIERQKWEPTLPYILRNPVCTEYIYSENSEKCNVKLQDNIKLQELFPHTWGQKCCIFKKNESIDYWNNHLPMRIGVVLSGGQAPGGHNVISGIYDYIKQSSATSQLFGFIGGPHGIFTHNYVEINHEFMNTYRNQGGFHMIKSGRHKIETNEQKLMSLNICKKLDLQGLVVIGGDDSNTNAAILAEYFKANDCNTRVIGCPKTIDGDLKNEFIEISFGFDTATKTYTEFIGNLCLDVLTSGKYYHFIRLMGRSASNIALECALQTRPNLSFIGEEIQAKNISLSDIVGEIVDLIIKRNNIGKDFGVILIPEGLIEFIPEIGNLIKEVNLIVANDSFSVEKLTEKSRQVFENLPKNTQQQLLLDRDPHGNVQVAMIATERLLISMVEMELDRRGLKDEIRFAAQSHYFGYEGRCGMPSNFDANYCYALGFTAAALIDNNVTGYMAVINNLHKKSDEWKAGGCPLNIMMNIEHRKGKYVPVIKKYLVDLNSTLFKLFAECRDEWKLNDMYRSTGPIQFDGPLADVVNYTISPPTKKELLPASRTGLEHMSLLEKNRLNAKIVINPILTSVDAALTPGNKIQGMDAETKQAVLKYFPMQCNVSGHKLYNVCEEGNINRNKKYKINNNINDTKQHKHLKVGVVLTGQQSPGVNNVLWGLFERITLVGGELIGFKGAKGLCNKDYISIDSNSLSLYKNQGGFELLKRTPNFESLIAAPEYIDLIRKTCDSLDLHGLVMIGGRWTLTDSVLLAESFLKNNSKTAVVAVPATQNNNIDHNFVECTLGFDTASKCVSQLIGNLLTDAASATKYWYFIRLTGRDKSHIVLESALQSHPNCTVVSEVYASQDKTLRDVVMDIADIINARSDAGKDFGAVLIPEGLLSELSEIRQLLHELNRIWINLEDHHISTLTKEFVELDTSTNTYSRQLSGYSMSLLKSLPQFIRAQLIQPRTLGRFCLSSIASEELISKLVAAELHNRKLTGLYKGNFSPVCFYFGYQVRSSLPSQFDCALGLSHGYLAGMCVESGLTGYATSIRGLCGPSIMWRPCAFPITSILKMQSDELYASKVPMVSSYMVKLDGKALRKVKSALSMWGKEDRFCNPGPLQFYGTAMHFYNRYLFEQQHEYLKVIGKINEHLAYLSRFATFGVDEISLRTTCVLLNTLKSILSVQNKEDENADGDGEYTTQMTVLNHL